MNSQGAHARQTGALKPPAAARLPAWFAGYCALALFNVLILGASLWLNQREMSALNHATTTYSAFAKVLEQVNAIGQDAFDMQAPANDLFSSKNVELETKRLNAAKTALLADFAKLRAVIVQLPADARAKIQPDFLKSESEISNTWEIARAVIEAYAAKDDAQATLQLAKMNSRFNANARRLFGTARFIRSDQFGAIDEQRARANMARTVAAWLMVLAVALAVAAAFHGWRIHVAMKLEALHRERQMRQLARARDQAQQAVRVKAQFLATMSHEIRTPMNGVLGMLDALSATTLSQSQAGFLKTANSSADLLLSMIDDVLDFSLIDAGMLSVKNAPVELRDLAQRTLALHNAPAREKHLALRIELPDMPIYVSTDATRLSQVLCNYLGNAIKFTPSGSVTLSLEVLEEQDEKLRIKFSVKDTGIGVDDRTQAKLFKPFTQADGASNRRFGGSGLGLALCKHLAKLLDESGEVGMSSTLGAGSTFYVALTLPTLRTQNTTAEVAEGANLPGRKFSGKVLVAEDNETNRQVMITMLRALGMQSVTANDGREAIAKFQSERFDLVLMDYHMPELDGCDATIGIREYETLSGRVRTPIIAVTASVLAEDREKCLASGMDDFVAKPLRQRTLAGMLDKWLPAGLHREADATDPFALFDQTWSSLPRELFDLEQLLEMRGIAGDVFHDLIEQFHGSAVDGLASMRNAIEMNDAIALKRAAHKLKGAAATLGARTVAERCHALEVIGKEQRMDAAAEQLHCLEQDYLQARRYMEACVQHKTAPAA